MLNEGTVAASRAAMVAFALVFLLCLLRKIGMTPACFRGAIVALATFLAVKLIYHLFFNALVDELSDYLRKENSSRKQ